MGKWPGNKMILSLASIDRIPSDHSTDLQADLANTMMGGVCVCVASEASLPSMDRDNF